MQFEKYLRSEGIRHERTVPKTPQQNGVAERLNRTLMEIVRSMLIDSNLPHEFWAEALATAVYLKNRSPTRAVDGLTPFEALNLVKPVVSHLRVFGCDAYSHISKDERDKLASKARKGIFVGYGQETKGYRIYDPDRRKVFFSRDTEFNEERKDVTSEATEVRCPLVVDFPVPVEDHAPRDEELDERPVSTLRRSDRVRRPPDYYGLTVSAVEPLSIEQALDSPDCDKWKVAMEKEMKSLDDNDTWELAELPEGHTAVGSKWVYKIKTKADGSIERYKARLVAQGFTQEYGVDYNETFSPVVKMESFRGLVALQVGCEALGSSILMTALNHRCSSLTCTPDVPNLQG